MVTPKPPSPAMEFLVSSLKANRNTSYAELKAKADEKKLSIFPIMFGRAQLLLGHVKAGKRGLGKAARSTAAKVVARRGRPANGSSKSGQVRELLKTGMSAADIAKKVGCTVGLVYNIKSTSGGGKRRGPGRPRKTSSAGGMDGLAGILDAVKQSERDRGRMRAALERIQAVVVDVLN